MLRTKTISLVLFLLVLFPAACFSEGQRVQTLKIAALYNTTGGMSSIDGPGLDGVKLAAEMINQKGGLLRGRKVEIIAFDTKTDARLAAEAAREAVKMGVVAGVGYGDSTYVLAAAPVFQSAGIPFITSGATLPDLPKVIGNHLFMAAFGDDAQAHAVADFAYKTLKARSVVVWTDSTMAFTSALSGYFKQRFTARGGKILDDEPFPSGKKDFSQLVERLKRTKPDAVFIAAIPDEAGLTVKQIRQKNIFMPILSGDGFDTDLILTIPGKELADNIYFSTHVFRGEIRKEVVDFAAAYKRLHTKEPDNAFCALGFDAMNLLADAIERAGTIERKALTSSIASTKGFRGVTGDISYGQPGKPPEKPVAVIGVMKGTYRTAEVWRP
ncbi:MAG: Leucine-specific-binding protein precursor [Syntrophorhabdaceae bacterium PtaU1.Bin034]|nr:MAG: Leucine-specific-binding protein precursor [Syntrophorhabdaceae bacterium PtaU1.Bin034]